MPGRNAVVFTGTDLRQTLKLLSDKGLTELLDVGRDLNVILGHIILSDRVPSRHSHSGSFH